MRERNRRPKIAFLVVNVEICGSPKQHDTFRKNVKKKSNVGELAKKKRLRHSQQSKSESNGGLTKGNGL